MAARLGHSRTLPQADFIDYRSQLFIRGGRRYNRLSHPQTPAPNIENRFHADDEEARRYCNEQLVLYKIPVSHTRR